MGIKKLAPKKYVLNLGGGSVCESCTLYNGIKIQRKILNLSLTFYEVDSREVYKLELKKQMMKLKECWYVYMISNFIGP